MTEQEWLECADPEPMLEFLDDHYDHAAYRKLGLFGVACCYRIWGLLRDDRSRKAVEVAERFADGAANEQELEEARQAASEAAGLGRYGGDDCWGRNSFAAGTEGPAKAAAWAATWRSPGSIELCNAAATAAVPTWAELPRELLAQAGLLRCLFGPLPFHPVAADPTWVPAKVVDLAQTIYRNRAFDRLPILADALEDAGCTNAEMLNHCRQPGEHVRGCWAVDLVLGKK
jgi:hypothetical protein